MIIYMLTWRDRSGEHNLLYRSVRRAMNDGVDKARELGHPIGTAPYWTGDIRPGSGGGLVDAAGRRTSVSVYSRTVL